MQRVDFIIIEGGLPGDLTESTNFFIRTLQTDTVTISGISVPTGDVTFFICGPTEVDATGCPEGIGTQVGAPIELVGGSATSEEYATLVSELRSSNLNDTSGSLVKSTNWSSTRP